ncbi:[FeFe] hydrogenase H-cluster maturation GTPase HydF [Fusobacterium sp. IOR10]|uniref:[FeFe] hydrogenase H-cluster maturation GTPase HydF n=1 Tax=Fusobacterium sp. IOR10 TaxID=2665157 RepID=UPI0013CFE128|nr:[FeFe] hydrogenase H-cluster maturation GTPase HydF [Fusobacterium sp. IOR10]
METTPNSNRFKITIIGSTNAGKSSLLNAITDQEISIVSDVKGTTTDSVKKAMEFLPFGPVLFIDTAGFNDDSKLGTLRTEKTIKEIRSSDFVIYVIDGRNFNLKLYNENILILKKYSIPYINVVTREEKLNLIQKKEIKKLIKNCFFVNTNDRSSILNFKEILLENLNVLESEPGLLDGISSYGDTIVMVIPIDSEAPKGRLILPQVQLLRAALDKGVKSIVCRDTELEEILNEKKRTDISLIITDSQIFKKVDKMVNDKFPLTSFSIIFARQKGDLKKLISGIEKINSLKDGAQILISENCTHNTSHEDIGRVKIPKLLERKTGKKFRFSFSAGKDFPKDLKKYDLVIHCGACMITKKNMEIRINECEEENVEITNYGLILAYLSGILEKSINSILEYKQ